MTLIYVTKDLEKGTLIFASSSRDYVVKKTNKYFENLNIHRNFIVDVVAGVEPKKDEII
jgi:hypothetical protein